METKKQMVEYKFLRANTYHPVPKMRFTLAVILGVFQLAFIIFYAFFADYNLNTRDQVPKMYSMFMDVHSMMFVGFGFLMTFLKRYGYGSVGFNFLIAAFVLQWALLVRGFVDQGTVLVDFEINIQNLLVADFCAAAVLISFGAVLGKTSLTQLVIMAFVEVILQSVNEHIGLHFLKAYDIGESIYVHVFGAYFGLAVAKILHNKQLEDSKESSNYHSDLFSMIGTVFLWIYWPSFNSATGVDEGQTRAIVNTYLSIAASCITTFMISILLSKGRLNMVHVQNATLAGGVAIGTVADMAIRPWKALVIGSLAGILSTVGFQFITPILKKLRLHDTCGVHNLHGMPGILAGLFGAWAALTASREKYGGNRLYTFYPARAPSINSTDYEQFRLKDSIYADGGDGRSASSQAWYQLAAIGVTLLIALVGGAITGIIMKLPIFEQVKDEEEMFDDEPAWLTPDDYSLKLTEVRVQREEEDRAVSSA